MSGKRRLRHCPREWSPLRRVARPSRDLGNEVQKQEQSADGGVTELRAEIDWLQGRVKGCKYQHHQSFRSLSRCMRCARLISGRCCRSGGRPCGLWNFSRHASVQSFPEDLRCTRFGGGTSETHAKKSWWCCALSCVLVQCLSRSHCFHFFPGSRVILAVIAASPSYGSQRHLRCAICGISAGDWSSSGEVWWTSWAIMSCGRVSW